jgi:hypothetical protein
MGQFEPKKLVLFNLLLLVPEFKEKDIHRNGDRQTDRQTYRQKGRDVAVLGKVKIGASRVWVKYQRQINKGLNCP